MSSMFKWNLVWAECATLLMILLLILAFLSYRAYIQQQIMRQAETIIQHGGVSQMERLMIGGTEQYILVEGMDLSKPVCLFLQGGPGSTGPFGVSSRAQYPDMTKSCIAVYWDQRGSGKSNYRGKARSITREQLILDAGEIVDYVRDKYARDRLFIIGNTTGTRIGTELARRYPEKLYAYIGWGSLSHVIDNGRVTEVWIDQETDRQSDWQNIKQIVFSPDYTLRDIYSVFASRAFPGQQNERQQEGSPRSNLLEQASEIHIPLYFYQGHDLERLRGEWIGLFDEAAYR